MYEHSEQIKKLDYKPWYTSGWVLWAVAALYYGYEFIHRVAPSVLTGYLREAFSINDHQLATVGAMYFYAYAAMQLPAGIIIDRFGVKRVLVLASLILTVGSFIFSLTNSSEYAHLSRLMIGAGSAFAFVGCLKIGRQWLALTSFPLVIGLTNLCGTLGALMGGTPLALLAHQIGWRDCMLIISFIGLIITFLLWLVLRDNAGKPNPSLPACHLAPNLLSGLPTVLKSPRSWLIALYGALLVAPIAALPEMWGVEYLKISYEISATHAATITQTTFIGTAVGGPLIGWFLSYHIEDEIDLMMLASLAALVLLTIFLYWVNMPLINLYFVLFFYGIFTANMLLCFDLITRLHPVCAHGAAIGFINMIVMATGGLAQHGIGWILNELRTRHMGIYLVEDYRIALSILPFCLLFAISITFFLKKDSND